MWLFAGLKIIMSLSLCSGGGDGRGWLLWRHQTPLQRRSHRLCPGRGCAWIWGWRRSGCLQCPIAPTGGQLLALPTSAASQCPVETRQEPVKQNHLLTDPVFQFHKVFSWWATPSTEATKSKTNCPHLSPEAKQRQLLCKCWSEDEKRNNWWSSDSDGVSGQDGFGFSANSMILEQSSCPEISSHHSLAAEKQSPKKLKHSKNKKPAATILLILFVEDSVKKVRINRKVTLKKKKLELTCPQISLCLFVRLYLLFTSSALSFHHLFIVFSPFLPHSACFISDTWMFLHRRLFPLLGQMQLDD